MANKLILPLEAKKDYLHKLSKRCIKILYLIEDETKNTVQDEHRITADDYIVSQLFEVNSANILFDGALVDVIVKLNGIRDYKHLPYSLVGNKFLKPKALSIIC